MRWHRIVEQQVELISLARADGTLVYANPAYAAHFGHTPAAMVGASLFDHVADIDRAAMRAVVQAVMDSGQSQRIENRSVGADGHERWVAWTNSRHEDDGPDGALLLSVGRDTTGRHLAERALRESQSFLLRTGRAAGVGGWQLDLASGRVTWSDETRRIHEVAADFEPTLDTAIHFYAPEAQPAIEAAVQRCIATAEPWDLELPLITATGRRIWARAVGEAEFEDGRAVRLVGAFQDITQSRALMQRAEDDERLLRQIADNVPIRLALLDADARYRLVNSTFERWAGKPREQIVGRSAPEVIGQADYEFSLPYIRRALAGENVSFERLHTVAGRVHHLAVNYAPLRKPDGTGDGFVAMLMDISHHREEAVRLQQLSQVDALTGLLNRTGFEQAAELLLREGQGPNLALLYIDLDRFKPVNDEHGHQVGDEVLKVVAQRLRALVRPSDLAARLGGDEFVLLLAGLHGPGPAHAVGRKVVAAAARSIVLGERRMQVGASVGVAFGVGTDTAIDLDEDSSRAGLAELVARADAMLYRAKGAGRGTVAVEPGLQRGAAAAR
jgi:diguanylate cyclase (GGDEF)-like protein/PAS domain S-box-containing protein